MFDLPRVRDMLAADFEGCTTLVPPGEKVRVFVGSGSLVPYQQKLDQHTNKCCGRGGT